MTFRPKVWEIVKFHKCVILEIHLEELTFIVLSLGLIPILVFPYTVNSASFFFFKYSCSR